MRVIFYILEEITAARCEKRKEFVLAVALWKKNSVCSWVRLCETHSTTIFFSSFWIGLVLSRQGRSVRLESRPLSWMSPGNAKICSMIYSTWVCKEKSDKIYVK